MSRYKGFRSELTLAPRANRIGPLQRLPQLDCARASFAPARVLGAPSATGIGSDGAERLASEFERVARSGLRCVECAEALKQRAKEGREEHRRQCRDDSPGSELGVEAGPRCAQCDP